MLKQYVYDVGAGAANLVTVVAESTEAADERMIAQGHTHYYLLTTCPVESKIHVCKRCGDVYDSEELFELEEMGEHFNKEPFLCPDCYDEFRRLDGEDQIKALVEGRYDW